MASNHLKKIDTKEFELPETVFVRDIDSRVFQSIALQCLAKIEGIALLEGSFIDKTVRLEIDVPPDMNGRIRVPVDINGIKAKIELFKLAL